MGINTRFYAPHFEQVLSCEFNQEYIDKATTKVIGQSNVLLYKKSSPDFLRQIKKSYQNMGRIDTPIFYLDAHFYDPNRLQKWVVRDELDALRGFNNCIIVIHDFDNGKHGHCIYDGEPLGMKVVREKLLEVNPYFSFYTNRSCDIIKEEDVEGIDGLVADSETIDNIRYAHSEERLTKRGLLYCTPKPLNSKYNLDEIKFRK